VLKLGGAWGMVKNSAEVKLRNYDFIRLNIKKFGNFFYLNVQYVLSKEMPSSEGSQMLSDAQKSNLYGFCS
jgi:hypothetical protein